MSAKVETSWKSILKLTEDILKCVKKIETLGKDLSSRLKTLGATFQDEGYVTIQGYIKKTQKKVDNSVPDLTKVKNALIEVAKLLKAAEEATKQ